MLKLMVDVLFSWPGMVVIDSFHDASVGLDYKGDPEMYHIEFLGKRRSHCWVGEDSVELYGRPAGIAALRTSKAVRIDGYMPERLFPKRP